ncbi:hypothetical protein ACFLVC_01725 [Chloroflexota bacterium]
MCKQGKGEKKGAFLLSLTTPSSQAWFLALLFCDIIKLKRECFMEEEFSLKFGDNVRIINPSNRPFFRKTGCVDSFLPGKQLLRDGTFTIKNLVSVKLDDSGKLEQFRFDELEIIK